MATSRVGVCPCTHKEQFPALRNVGVLPGEFELHLTALRSVVPCSNGVARTKCSYIKVDLLSGEVQG